ncbi:hypothetical protein [Paraburkholderia caribensis]|uniref:Uncharacterized protein n=1 Tax=Paraburkholderia caribensis TaxID=75105 RepID=A0A9Q6S2R4_9BURK|nr:hypothetical protein [Paraburkholderia caribensis]QLB63473.1 hypothetical protein A9O66_14430 [Paraburkholderia caribensis]
MNNDCLAALSAGAGRAISDDEADRLLSKLQAHQRMIELDRPLMSAHDVAVEAARRVGEDLKQAAFIQRRNALLNATIRAERVQWIINNFGARPAEGLEALLVGVNRAKQGARNSVAAVQKTLRDRVLGGFVYDLEKINATKLFASGALDRDVARAMWAIGRPNEVEMTRGLAPMALEIARVINKWQEYVRTSSNDAGAWIGQRAGYIVRQSHDMLRIRNAGYQAWRDAADRFFDLPRMMAKSGATNADALLKAVHTELASGNFMRLVTEVENQPFKGPGNLAKKISQERIIYFKDADSWFDYNQQFGSRSLREAVASGLSHGAEQLGLLRQLGPNPEAMIGSIAQQLREYAANNGEFSVSDAIKAATDPRIGSLKKYMAAVDGTMRIPGNALWARRFAGIRAWQSLAKLGGMILSQFNDVAVYGSEAKYQGRGFLSGMAESMVGLGTNLKTEERRELLSSLGVFFESALGEIARTGSFDDAGALTRSQSLFFRLNLGQWWTEKMRAAAAMGMSHHMALQIGKTWDALEPEYRRVLSLYDLDGPKWDVIRQSALKQVDDRPYIAPDTIGQVSDDVVRTYLQSVGKQAGEKEIAAARADLADKVQTYFNDRTGFFQLEPDAKTRAILLQGTQPGTWLGEFTRLAMQFKSFTGAYMQKIMGRELYGRGYEGMNPIKALGAGNGEALGLANVVLISTLFGYGSMLAKDLMRGQTPRVPSSDPTEDLKLFVAAMAQGGGMGLMGDFLFGSANRFGGGPISTALGPSFGALNDIVMLYQNARDDAIEGKSGNIAANALRVALNNAPYLNLFYTRIALDYIVFYRLQEMLNPGYLSRMEQRVRTQSNQQFILPPSSVVR